MSMPAGETGLDTPFSPWGQTNTLTSLAGFDQNSITSFFSGALQDNPVLKGASTVFFDVILGGFQSITNFVNILTQAITGAFGSLGDISGFLSDRWNDIANLFGFVQNIIDAIVQGFRGIPFIGNTIADLLESVLGIVGIGTTAQGTADSALAIATLNGSQLNSTGGRLVDTFDRPAAPDLGSAWDQSYKPGGTGTLGTNGTNDAAWATSGGASSWVLARNVTALTTNIQSASIVVAPFVSQPSSTGDTPEEWVFLRCNSAKTEYVIGKVGAGWAEIGYAIGGVYTRLGARVTGLTSTSGVWELRAGTIGSDYEFTLSQGTAEIVRRTDSGPMSQMDSSHLYAGFGQYVGTDFFFFFPVQAVPPNVQTFTAIDRAATL